MCGGGQQAGGPEYKEISGLVLGAYNLARETVGVCVIFCLLFTVQ